MENQFAWLPDSYSYDKVACGTSVNSPVTLGLNLRSSCQLWCERIKEKLKVGKFQFCPSVYKIFEMVQFVQKCKENVRPDDLPEY